MNRSFYGSNELNRVARNGLGAMPIDDVTTNRYSTYMFMYIVYTLFNKCFLTTKYYINIKHSDNLHCSVLLQHVVGARINLHKSA